MSEELHELTAGWLGTEISEERRRELLARLRDDAEFRAAFISEARMFAMLRAVQSPEPRWLALQDELGLTEKSNGRFAEEIREGIKKLPRPFVAAWWRPLAQFAACIALVFGVLFFIKSHSSPPTANGAERIAVVVRTDGIVWASGTPQRPAVNDAVSSGALRIASGRLTLACLNGVILHIEGPADLHFVNAERIRCHRGNVRALVADGAEGFTIETPGAAIVDLGTEFGVQVDDAGSAQVVVYQGKAETALLASDGSARRTQTLVAQESVELKPSQNSIRSVPARELLPAPDLQIPALNLSADYPQRILASEPLHYWRGYVSNSAISNISRGGNNLRVTGDVRPSSDSSLAFTGGDATQFLRMDSTWTPSENFAIELWFASEAFHGSVLVVLQSTTSPHGELCMLELTARGRNAPTTPGRVRFLYRWPPGGADGVNLFSLPLYHPWRWNHLVCQRRGNQLEMFLNGIPAGSTPLAGTEASTSCILRFGCLNESPSSPVHRQFQGRLAEMAIYERPLSAEEIKSHAAQ